MDGSCLGNQNVDETTEAGWGLVIISGDTGLGRGTGTVFEELFGRVITNPEESNYLGAEIGSNNTGELSSFAHALRWCLKEGGEGEIIIRTDSTYAGNMADGSWNAKTNLKLVEFVQELWLEVASMRRLSWNHVKAHRGHRWNERADHLALRAALGEIPKPLSFWKPGQR